MQVNQIQTNRSVSSERQLKQGEVLRGVSFEPISDTEAKMTHRGKELRVTVEGPMPKAGVVSLQVTQTGDEGIQVKEWSQEQTTKSATSQGQMDEMDLAKKAGIERPTPTLLAAIKIARTNGMPLTNESIQALSKYIGTSSDPARLQTIQSLATKKLPITNQNIQSVHETLHGRPIHHTINELNRLSTNISKVDLLHMIQQLTTGRSLTDSESQMINQLRTLVDQNALPLDPEQVKQFIKAYQSEILNQLKSLDHLTNEDLPFTQNDRMTSQKDVLQQLKQQIETEQSPQQAFKVLQESLQHQQSLAVEQVNHLIEASGKAIDRLNNGRELAARQIMFDSIDQELNKMNTYERQADIQQSAVSSSKQIAVTTVTEKMASLTTEFRTMQRDMSLTLRQIAFELAPSKPMDAYQAKNQLESIIRKLDHSILRGELMQFADMKTEKSLMLASSRLGEARQLLASGKQQEAAKVVSEVQKQVEALSFKPSETKIQHVAGMKQLERLTTPSTPMQLFTEAALKGKEGTARSTFEMVRQLGLTHESEAAQRMSRDIQVVGETRNVKQALLQMMQKDEGAKVSQLANQAVNHITGQQLLSKQDGQPIQSLFFQLPLILEQKVEQLQCFIQSKKEGEQVDWQNCSLYFLMETTKLGEIGISVRVAQRQLSVTLQNDQEQFKEKMEPLVAKATKKIEEIGYSISGISFSPLGASETKSISKPSSQPVYTTEKGFDFKI